MKNKINIMKAKPPVTDDEIKGYMNFDGVLQQHQEHLKPTSNWKRVFTIALSTSLIAVSVYLLIPDQSPDSVSRENVATPTIVSNDSVTVMKKDSAIVNIQQPKEKISQTKALPLIRETKTDSNQADVSSVRATTKYDYHEAEPQEGYPHLYEYFSRELQYPKESLQDSIQGTVSVSFIINKEGKPEKIIIQNSLGKSFDQESLRLINNMPSWRPARLNNNPVPVRISVPLTFMIIKTKSVNKKQ